MAKPHTLIAPGLRVTSCLFLAFLAFAVDTITNAQQSTSGATSEDRERGIQLYKQGDIKGAVSRLQAAVKEKRDDAEAWYYLGLALTRDDQAKLASKAYETALKLQPNFAGARAGLAFTLLLRNKLNEALAEAKRALTLDASSVDAHYIIGVVQLRKEDNTTALAEANAAQVTGTVVLRAVFTADGQVRYIVVVRGLTDGLTEASIAAARKIKFVPAIKDGKPVSMFMQLEYNFNLY